MITGIIQYSTNTGGLAFGTHYIKNTRCHVKSIFSPKGSGVGDTWLDSYYTKHQVRGFRLRFIYE